MNHQLLTKMTNNTAKQGGAYPRVFGRLIAQTRVGIFYLILDVILVLLLDFHYQIHDTFQFFHFFEISDFCHFCDFNFLHLNSYSESYRRTIHYFSPRLRKKLPRFQCSNQNLNGWSIRNLRWLDLKCINKSHRSNLSGVPKSVLL